MISCLDERIALSSLQIGDPCRESGFSPSHLNLETMTRKTTLSLASLLHRV